MPGEERGAAPRGLVPCPFPAAGLQLRSLHQSTPMASRSASMGLAGVSPALHQLWPHVRKVSPAALLLQPLPPAGPWVGPRPPQGLK